MSEAIILKNAAAVVERGIPPAFPKSYYITELAKRADAIRAVGERPASAYARAMTDDQIGRMLWRASKAASGPEIDGDVLQDEVPQQRRMQDFGPAHAELEALARDHHLANPLKTIEGARAAVYADPANAKLRERVKTEHFNAMLGNMSHDVATRGASDEAQQQRDATRAAQQRARDIGGSVHGGPSPAQMPDSVDKRAHFAKRDDAAIVETLPNGTRVLSLEATRLAKAAGERYDRARLRA